MRKRPVLLATVVTMALAITFGPSSGAQESRRSSRRSDQNPSGGPEPSRRAAHSETIRGVIAGITAEGEMTLDYRHDRAVAAEAAFLTVVGAPVKSEKHQAGHRDTAREEERHGRSARRRHNIYIVWLSPRTKINECLEESGKSRSEPGQASHERGKKDVTLDQLEVGDHVEIQFNRREETDESHIAHQSERMRQKHGRHRTHVGYATEVTILLPTEDEHSRSGSPDKDKEPSR
jgi:hypothetical protein